MKRVIYPGKKEIQALLMRPVDTENILEMVRPMLRRVKQGGDDALLEFTERFDHVRIKDIAVTPEEIADAGTGIGGWVCKSHRVLVRQVIHQTYTGNRRLESVIVTQPRSPLPVPGYACAAITGFVVGPVPALQFWSHTRYNRTRILCYPFPLVGASSGEI